MPEKNTMVLVISAHQDDEFLTFGGQITQAVHSGAPVRLACLGLGEKTCVRGVLADGGSCDWHPGAHEYTLSAEDITACRDEELRQSVRCLGLTASDIVFPAQRNADNEHDIEVVKEQVKALVGCYNPAVVVTHSPLARHVGHTDHRAIGLAVWDLAKRGGLPATLKLTFCVEPYCTEDVKETWPGLPLETSFGGAGMKDAMAKVAASYQNWDPANKHFGIGYHSVRREFEDFLAKPSFTSHGAGVLSATQVASEIDYWLLQRELRRARAEAAAVQGRVQALEAEVEALRAQNETSKQEVAGLRNNIDEFYKSNSYRVGRAVTAPARVIKRKLK